MVDVVVFEVLGVVEEEEEVAVPVPLELEDLNLSSNPPANEDHALLSYALEPILKAGVEEEEVEENEANQSLPLLVVVDDAGGAELVGVDELLLSGIFTGTVAMGLEEDEDEEDRPRSRSGRNGASTRGGSSRQHARAGAFAADAGGAGVDGVLVVDYPLEVSAGLSRELQRHGMDMILLLTPATSDERIRLIAERASGYAYSVSVKGVTGVRSLDLDQVRHTLRRARRHISLPLGVGFGIRDAATAQAVAQMSDAVIVGSWLLETLRGKTAEQALHAAGALIQNLRRHLDATKASAS